MLNRKNGFTLIEVLIATMVMLSVLGTLVYGLSQCSKLTETVQNQDIALSAAQDKLEEIANSDLSQVMSNYNGHTFSVVDAEGNSLLTAPSGQNEPGQVTVVQVGTTDLYDVTVTVSWQQKGGIELSRTITTTLVQK